VRLSVTKQVTLKSEMVRFHLKKLNNVEGTENYKVQSSNSLAALENLQDNVDIKGIKREY
jgi:hypothetical protein